MDLKERIISDEKGDTRLGTFLGVFGIFMITIIIIFASTNAVSTGLDVGRMFDHNCKLRKESEQKPSQNTFKKNIDPFQQFHYHSKKKTLF